jgi:hypothetical protein
LRDSETGGDKGPMVLRSRALVGLFVVLGLIAAACGSDAADEATSDDTSSTTVAETTTTVPPDDETNTTTTEGADTTTTTEPPELTASFRGVTPEVIKVGVTSFDWDALAELGVSLGRSTSEDIYVAALEAINDRGGIGGRMLEIHAISYLPVGTAKAEETCVELTEDHEVFVVVGDAIGDEILCVTELHETAAIMTAGMTLERAARARAPYATVIETTEGRSEAFVAAMDEQGLLDGHTIGVAGSADVSEATFNSTIDALETAGYEPVNGLSGDNNEDLVASAGESDVFYERFRLEGVDTTIETTGVPLAFANAVNAGYVTDQWLLVTPSVVSGLTLADVGVDPSYLDNAYSAAQTAIGTSLQPMLGDDPGIATCVEAIEEGTGRDLTYELDQEINDLAGALSACSFALILEAALTNAGPELTNESFQAGLEAIGEIDLPGYSEASLGPGDFAAAKGFLTLRFNAETGTWDPVG